jgi:hypothetical protein
MQRGRNKAIQLVTCTAGMCTESKGGADQWGVDFDQCQVPNKPVHVNAACDVHSVHVIRCSMFWSSQVIPCFTATYWMTGTVPTGPTGHVSH